MIRTHTLTFYVVRCDYCGHQNRMVADGFHDEETAVRDALDHGWFCTAGSYHLCPACAAPFTEPS